MDPNPYAPPVAPISDFTEVHRANPQGPFFAVSIFKLVVMSTCTLGLYHLYWFFQNWRRVRSREDVPISPFWRTFFSYFFCYGLFARVRDYEHTEVAPSTLGAGVLAIFWVLLSMTWRLPDPYGIISLLAFLPLIPVQRRANHINAAVALGHDPNARFTVWNWLVVVVGGLLIALAVVGAFLIDEDVS